MVAYQTLLKMYETMLFYSENVIGQNGHQSNLGDIACATKFSDQEVEISLQCKEYPTDL